MSAGFNTPRTPQQRLQVPVWLTWSLLPIDKREALLILAGVPSNKIDHPGECAHHLAVSGWEQLPPTVQGAAYRQLLGMASATTPRKHHVASDQPTA